MLPPSPPEGQAVRFYRDTGLSLDEVTTTGYTIQWQNEGQAAPHRATFIVAQLSRQKSKIFIMN